MTCKRKRKEICVSRAWRKARGVSKEVEGPSEKDFKALIRSFYWEPQEPQRVS